jgi:hypothetical protein
MKIFYLICVGVFFLAACQTGAKRICINGYKERMGIDRTIGAGTDSEVPTEVINICACVGEKAANGYDVETATIECRKKYGSNQ